MEPRKISTDSGMLELIPASVDQLRGIGRYWPMGLITGGPGLYGLVFQHGDHEVHGVKMQPIDVPAVDAKMLHFTNRALIAAALPSYLAKGHRGVMVPCAYYREKAAGTVESGIAFFVGPDAESRPKSVITKTSADVMYDEQLGDGATSMIFDMVAAIKAGSKTCGLPLFTAIGIDVRPRLAIGGLAMYFVVEGPRVFVIKDALEEGDTVWDHLVRAGFSTLPYAPLKPVALPDGPLSDVERV